MTTETRSTARRGLVAAAWTLIVATYPIVWAIGYQDHPWRNGPLAIIVSAAAVAGSLVVMSASGRSEPPIPRGIGWLAVIVTSAALLSALMWAFFESSLSGPID